jgi:hypothetical protein
VEAALPIPRQYPELQATHDDACVKAAPPDEKVPEAQGLAVALKDAAGQKNPAGQAACVSPADHDVQ